MMNLRTGMTEDQILGELRGKVQGENAQDYKQFVHQKFNHVNNDKQLHEVILNDENYALIVKWNYYRTITKKLEFVNEYYLCGISDEGYYFIKEISDFGTRFPVFPESMKEIVDNINKKSDNFQRLQGDVLYKMFDFGDLIFEDENTLITPNDDVYDKKIIYDRIIFKLKKSITGKLKIGFDDWGFSEARIFTNHCIMTDGLVYAQRRLRNLRPTSDRDYELTLQNAAEIFIVRGTYFELKHNEHDRVRVEIPQEKVVHLTPQIYKQNNYYD